MKGKSKMIVYIAMLALSLLFSYLSTKITNKKIKILLQILSVLPFFIVSAIRYDVGTDYMYRYKPDFESIKNGKNVTNLEYGYVLIVKMCLLISDNIELLFVVTSAIIIFIIFYAIYKYSKNPTLSIFIFFAGCFFFQSMNILRQYIAVSLILLGYEFLIKKKYKSFFICIILGFSVHTTSIIALVALLLTKKMIAKPKVVILLMLVLLVFSGTINNVINSMLSFTRFSVYTDSTYNRSEIKYTALVVNSILYMMCYYIVMKKKNIDRRDILYINIMGMSVLCVALGKALFLFNRMSYYFTIIQILSVPYFINVAKTEFTEDVFSLALNKENLKKKLGQLLNKVPIIKSKNVNSQNAIILTSMVVILLIANICYTNVLNNDDEVTPYKTIFEKK